MSDASLFDDLPFQLPPSSSQPPSQPTARPSPPPTASASTSSRRPESDPPRSRPRPRASAPGLSAPSQDLHDPPPPAAHPPVLSSPRASSSMPRATRRGQSLIAALTGQDVPSEVTSPALPGPSSRPSASHAGPSPLKAKARKGEPANKSDPAAQPSASAAPPAFKIVVRPAEQHSASPELAAPPSSTTSAIPIFVRDPSASTPSESTRTATPTDLPAAAAPPPPSAPHALEKPRAPIGTRQKAQQPAPVALDRTCHMHKSHKAQPRMTCLNAPDCRTVWCTKCVVQHYLACTPNGIFEPATLFLCPVCLDVCLCGNCKRQRLAVGRRSTSLDTPALAKDLEATAPRPKKKPRRTSTASDVSMAAPVVEQPRRTRKSADASLKMEVSDSEGDAASVSRLLRGAVGQGAARPTPMEDVKPSIVPEVAPAAAPAPPAYKLKVKPPRRRGSLDCAYDHPTIYVPLLPSTAAADSTAPPHPVAIAPALAPAATSLPAAYDKPGRRRPTVPRPPRIPRVPRSAAAHAAATSSSSAPTSTPALAPAPPSAKHAVHPHGAALAPAPATPGSMLPAPTYNSRPIMPTAAASRSRRTKRPSTAFDDYALDSATSSAAGLGDRYSPSYEIAQPAPATRKGGRQSGAASATMPASLKRKAPRRYSGISSASSCDELSSDDDGAFDDLFDAVPMVVEEQPLPVLAGLEKNLEGGAGSAGESLTFDEFGLALNLESAESLSARPKVKWIEGPERRRRRAMAAAAVAAVAAGETETSDAPTPEPIVVDLAKSVSPSIPSLSLPSAVDEPLRSLGGSASRSASEQPPASSVDQDNKAELARAAPDEQPPPYEAHYSTSTSSSSRPRPPASAPPASAAPGDDLRGRSPTDAKLAFALLDAVRAAVAPRDGSSSSGSSATTHGGGGGSSFGAAIDALFGTAQHGLSTSSASASLVNSPVKPITTGAASASPVPSSRSAAHRVDNVDLDAATAEAERRRATLAAAAEVDPVKAFKPLAAERADAQFFGAPVPLVEQDDDDSVDMADQQAPVVSRRETDDSAFGGFDDVFEFEIGSPVDDLWTPASAAESVGASARSTSTAPSSAFDERGVGVVASAVHAGLDDGAGPFSASASATPIERAGAQSCVSPTRGLLADMLACGDGLTDEDRAWGLSAMEDVCAA
ncbi:hypothetical protein JCM9279_001878 [Rhodotorula babjevae]